jgi:hypothetical protein
VDGRGDGQRDHRPDPGHEAAFKLNPTPDLVYFLSDGEFNNLRSYEEVGKAFAAGAAGKKVRVNTIQLETRDEEAERALRTIARANGGTYRYVREKDIEE